MDEDTFERIGTVLRRALALAVEDEEAFAELWAVLLAFEGVRTT